VEKDLVKFNNCVEVINKEISRYEDPKGTMFFVNTVNLLTSVEAMELSKEELQKAIFENKVDDLKYNIEKVEKTVSKYSITKKEEDRYTLTNAKVDVRKVYNVVNGLKIHKSYTTKEEALEVANAINSKYMKYLLEK
jgi:hypothetical protein